MGPGECSFHTRSKPLRIYICVCFCSTLLHSFPPTPNNSFRYYCIFSPSTFPVGRVYTSGEPELTKNVQQYDQSVYLRVVEAQRCHVNCCFFLPVFATSSRDRVAAVMEVVQTDDNERFAGLIDWAKVCLEGAGLWTIEAEGDTIGMGLRTITTEFEASAFESKVDERAGGVVRTLTGAASMPPPPPALAGDRSFGLGVHTQPVGWQNPGVVVSAAGTAAEADDAIGGSGHAEQKVKQVSRGDDAPAAAKVSLRPERIVQIGNHLIISADAPFQQRGWQSNQNNERNNNGILPSGRSGNNEAIRGVHASAFAAAAVNGGANGWASIERAVNVPQGYATSYGHGDNAITYGDLAPHFQLSLRNAAAKMEISVTTLKRACRRLGLQKWPRRELANKAMEASNKLADGHLFSWTSSQTISVDSIGADHHRVAAAAAFAAGQGGGDMPPYNTRTVAAAHHMIRPPVLNTEAAAQMVFVPGIEPPAGELANGGNGGIGGMNTQTHSLESLDILAAADAETFSVNNSPPGERIKGGRGDGDDGDRLFSTEHMPGPWSRAI